MIPSLGYYFYLWLLIRSESACPPGMRLCLTCWLVADFLCLGSAQKLVTREIILLLELLPNLSHSFKVEHLSSQHLCALIQLTVY